MATRMYTKSLGFVGNVENMCVKCGGEDEPCCMDSDDVEYCAGSNMKCDRGEVPNQL